MPSNKVTVTAATWTNLTNGDSDGVIRYVSGTKPLLLTQATAAPTLVPASANAISGELTREEEFATFYSLPAGEDVWGYCDTPVGIVVTPAG